MSQETKIYPQEVIDVTSEVISAVIDAEFFADNGIENHKIGLESARSVLSELFLKKFIAGETLAFASEDEVFATIDVIVADAMLESLTLKGYVDWYYDDERNEKMFFPTEKGKAEFEKQKKLKE